MQCVKIALLIRHLTVTPSPLEKAIICEHPEHNSTPNLCEVFGLFRRKSSDGVGKKASRRDTNLCIQEHTVSRVTECSQNIFKNSFNNLQYNGKIILLALRG